MHTYTETQGYIYKKITINANRQTTESKQQTGNKTDLINENKTVKH